MHLFWGNHKNLIIVIFVVAIFSIVFFFYTGFGSNQSKVTTNKVWEEVLKDPGKLTEFAIKPKDINIAHVVKLPSRNEVSSDIITITFKEGFGEAGVDKFVSNLGGKVVGQLPLPDKHFYDIKLAAPQSAADLQAFVEKLRKNPAINTASYSPIYKSEQTLPITDIENLNLGFFERWSFNRINLPAAWSKVRASGITLKPITVAVIDNGFDVTHPDLQSNLTMNYNGKVAWDFGDNDDNVSFDAPTSYYSDHGTAVAGIVAATINGFGMNGVAPTAKVFPLKTGRKEDPGSNYNTSKAVTYAALSGVDVINMSWGSSYSAVEAADYPNTAEYAALKFAASKGITLVASAGNDGVDANFHFPSAHPDVIAVGAINYNDERAIWGSIQSSNYSDVTTALTVAAPGDNLYTIVPVAVGTYTDEFGGTSGASPFVAGLAALLKQLGASSSAILGILRATADDILVTYPDGSEHTWKRINAERAVEQVLPYVPTSLPAVSGSDGPLEIMEGTPFQVNWASVDATGGCVALGNAPAWNEVVDTSLGNMIYQKGLPPGEYTFEIICFRRNSASAEDEVSLRVTPHEPIPPPSPIREFPGSTGGGTLPGGTPTPTPVGPQPSVDIKGQ